MPLAFTDRFRRRPVPAETPPGDRVAGAVRLVDPDATPTATRGTPTPSRRSQRPDGSHESQRPPDAATWPSPRTWLTATLTAADEIREDRIIALLMKLTDDLGSPLAAARRLFAPELLEKPHA